MPNNGFTALELRLMQVIWRLGPSTVSAVQVELQPELAYTTVQTVLNILERKGKLRRALEGRAYVYRAVESEERALGQAVRDLVDRMFGGSPEGLAMTLLKTRQIDAGKIAELQRRLDAQDAQHTQEKQGTPDMPDTEDAE